LGLLAVTYGESHRVRVVPVPALLCFPRSWNTRTMMTLADYRRFYAEEIRFAANLSSPAFVEAFSRVPREKFLGPGPWQVASFDQLTGGTTYFPIEDPRHLYHNVVIALDASRDLNSGQPGSLAYWINGLRLNPGDRVFHLGCGMGYYAAIMAEVVGPGGTVVASEVDPGLASRAAENLSPYPNVTVHSGDGAAVDPGACDAILINAGVTHAHPLWLDRLKQSGRLILPLTVSMSKNLGRGIMVKITRVNGIWAAQPITFAAIYSCSSVRDPQLEPLLGKALTTGRLLKLKSLRHDSHEPDATCVLHANHFCLSGADPLANNAASAPVPS